MIYSEFKAKTQKWNQFKQVDVLGSYDFFTTIVSLDAITSDDIHSIQETWSTKEDKDPGNEAKISADQYYNISKNLSIILHEYTHFIDSTSTLWGINHINKMNKAYLSNYTISGHENLFFNAKKFYDHIKKIRLPAYYTIVNNIENIRPWSSLITIGKLFSNDGFISNRPVLFSRFSNAHDDEIARSPISTVSILEASAMAQEILMKSALTFITDSDFSAVEQKIFGETIIKSLYDKNATEYSVCVHLLANTLHVSEVIEAFSLCSLLTKITLNFSQKAFDSVWKSCPIAEILGFSQRHSKFVGRLRDGIKNNDLGILYYLLCNALPKKPYEKQEDMIDGAVEALQKIGISYEVFRKSAQEEAEKLIAPILISNIKPLATLANACFDNFNIVKFDEIILDTQLSV
jgi:hypothetical protein